MRAGVLLLFFICSIYGATTVDSLLFLHPCGDVNSQPQLKREFQSLQAEDSFTVDFEQKKYIKALQKTVESSGSISIVKSLGLLWRVEKPYEMDVLITHNGDVYEDGEKQRNSSMKHAGSMLELFEFDFKALTKRFSPYVFIEGEQWNLGLKPNKKGVQRVMSHIILKGAFRKQVQSVTFVGTESNKTHINFSNHRQIGESELRALQAAGN